MYGDLVWTMNLSAGHCQTIIMCTVVLSITLIIVMFYTLDFRVLLVLFCMTQHCKQRVEVETIC